MPAYQLKDMRSRKMIYKNVIKIAQKSLNKSNFESKALREFIIGASISADGKYIYKTSIHKLSEALNINTQEMSDSMDHITTKLIKKRLKEKDRKGDFYTISWLDYISWDEQCLEVCFSKSISPCIVYLQNWLKDRSDQSIVESMSQNTQEGYSRSSVGYSKIIVKTKKELYEKTKGKTLVFLTAKGGAHNLEPSYEIRINNICISNYVKGSVYDALISGIIKAIEQLPDETDVAVVCGSSIGFAKYFRGKGVYYDQIDRLMDLVSAKSDTITEVFWKDGVSKISEIIKQ